jgi:hypothetical protein
VWEMDCTGGVDREIIVAATVGRGMQDAEASRNSTSHPEGVKRRRLQMGAERITMRDKECGEKK